MTKKACWQERQDFVDCVLVHSKCVQAGRPLSGCLEEDGFYSHSSGKGEGSELAKSCMQLFLGYMHCRRALLDPRQRLR